MLFSIDALDGWVRGCLTCLPAPYFGSGPCLTLSNWSQCASLLLLNCLWNFGIFESSSSVNRLVVCKASVIFSTLFQLVTRSLHLCDGGGQVLALVFRRPNRSSATDVASNMEASQLDNFREPPGDFPRKQGWALTDDEIVHIPHMSVLHKYCFISYIRTCSLKLLLFCKTKCSM